MGGSSKSQPVPTPAAPLDYGALMKSANDQARISSEAQFQSQLAAYPQIQALQLGTTRTIADNLNNSYTASALGAINAAMSERSNMDSEARNVSAAGGDLSTLGGGLAAFGSDQLASSGPNSIEQALYNQTGSDLALGSSLNPEEARAASQQATSAYAMRGLGTGSSAAAADLLNRYQYGQARLAQRQSAAIGADNAINANVIARQGVGLGALGQAGSMYSNSGSLHSSAGNIYNQSGQLALSAANAYLATDPYQRALGAGASFSGANLGNSSGIIGNSYNQSLGMAGNVGSFNANMLDTRYNSALNNNAAMSAADTAARGQMIGAGIGAAGQIGGSAAIAVAL